MLLSDIMDAAELLEDATGKEVEVQRETVVFELDDNTRVVVIRRPDGYRLYDDARDYQSPKSFICIMDAMKAYVGSLDL